MKLKIVFTIVGFLLCITVAGGIMYILKSRSVEKKSVESKEIMQSGALYRYLMDKANKIQSTADNNYTRETKDIQTSYPWFHTLPLHDNTYFIYFDLDAKQFFGTVLNSADPQIAKQNADAALKKIGVPLGKYPITWSIASRSATTK